MIVRENGGGIILNERKCSMKKKEKDIIHDLVREHYGKAAGRETRNCECSPPPPGCHSQNQSGSGASMLEHFGYSVKEVIEFHGGESSGLCCGNPVAIAKLRKGETVLDLGCGAGFDCYLAAKKVGETGYVIGIDMTLEMVCKARENISKWGFKNVEFRLGEIENLPVRDNSIDVIISNCVINLSPDKRKVFMEAFRVLRPRGRLAVSDIVATASLPEETRQNSALYVGCIAGAASMMELEDMLKKTDFQEIHIQSIDTSREIIRQWLPGRNIEDFVVSATIEATKP